MKKKWLPGAVILLVVISIGFVFVLLSKKEVPEKDEKQKKPTVVFPFDQLPENERPIIALTSRPDGKELTLKVESLKNFSAVEYELTYLTGGVQRGVIGTVQLKTGEESFSRNLLLGTCSRGVCRYDENVTGGTLTITFRGEKAYKYIQDFKLEKEKGKTVVVME